MEEVVKRAKGDSEEAHRRAKDAAALAQRKERHAVENERLEREAREKEEQEKAKKETADKKMSLLRQLAAIEKQENEEKKYAEEALEREKRRGGMERAE